MFFDVNKKQLNEFVKMSRIGGSRVDYVQGGGGNTSVKLPGGRMAIKASGFCLKDIGQQQGYAVVNCDFYRNHEP